MNRREFIKTSFISGAGALLNPVISRAEPGFWKGSRALPFPQVNTFSGEIVLNSRRSYHSGYSGTLSNQILANVLWATSRAPVIGANRIIYAALPDNVYYYDPLKHEIVMHVSGNHLSESKLAFEIGIASDLSEDAGASLQFANLAATSFWISKNNQPCCIPKESAYTNANSTWNPDLNIKMVNCYGFMGTVSGITSQCVAISSNGSLPDPVTDGDVLLENGLDELWYGNRFLNTAMTLDQISQLAWASYGNNPHTTSNARCGLTVPSAVANYYLTGRIYVVRPEGVERYHIRQSSGQPNTRDHRIERVTEGDRRSQLRNAVSRIPQTAPLYFVYCAAAADRWQLLEAGFAAGSALLQATCLDLQGYFTANFSSAERTAIISAIGIPSADLPLLIFSVGNSMVRKKKEFTNA